MKVKSMKDNLTININYKRVMNELSYNIDDNIVYVLIITISNILIFVNSIKYCIYI